MADPCQQCSCIPYRDICCCPPINGISVIQPACQTLADGSVVNNPCFNSVTNRSTWTYKFFTDCNAPTRGISSVAIPVCERISQSAVVVEEQIDGCNPFTPVAFSLSTTDPNFGTAPTGFQFLKIETSERYDKGVCVIYRITISGDFPLAAQPIFIKAATQILTFQCDGDLCFIVPACIATPELVVTKDCREIFTDNMVTFEYVNTISNVGEATANNILFNDQINYNSTSITIGTVSVTPPLTVDTSIPGIIRVTGNIGSLAPGGTTTVTIRVPISNVSAPGRYTINNTVNVSEDGSQSSDTCTLILEAVQLTTDKCCILSDTNLGTFRLTVASVGASPATTVDINDSLVVPLGVVVQMLDFDGCIATFVDGSPVPLNTDITNRLINIRCPGLVVPASGSISKNIRFRAVSTTVFGTAQILNTFDKLNFTNPTPQLILGAGPLPVSASINVVTTLQCTRPCM